MQSIFGTNNDGNEELRGFLLAQDREYEQIQENKYPIKPIPQQEPTQDSWLTTESLAAKIQEMQLLDRTSFSLRGYVETLPSLDQIEEICEKTALQLGLKIEFDEISSDPLYELELLIYWE